MSRLTRRFFCLAVLAVSISLLAACQKTTPSTPDLPDLKVGVVGVEQPKGTTDLLAGFIPEDRVLASDQAVATFNEELMKLLKTTTHRSYVFIPKAGGADPRERNGALAHWAKIGKDMGVDLLIVPQILDWRERAGSSAGVTTSAAVNMDFYLIDVREPGGALVSRSHFKEKQVGLSDNLMNFDTFLKRGAKWLTAQELAMEGMQKMIDQAHGRKPSNPASPASWTRRPCPTPSSGRPTAPSPSAPLSGANASAATRIRPPSHPSWAGPSTACSSIATACPSSPGRTWSCPRSGSSSTSS